MNDKPSYFQIGEVARRAKISIHAIRYYEKLGLLTGPSRSRGGFRLYGEDSVQRLLFIQKAKEFGLSLEEIEKITCCGEKGLGPCCDMTVKLFNWKIDEFEEKIKVLNQTKKKIRGLLSGWTKPKKGKSK